MAVAFYYPEMYDHILSKTDMQVPNNTSEDFDAKEFPHYSLFLNIHLGRPYSLYSLEYNANKILEIPADIISSGELQVADLFGEKYGLSIPDNVLD